MITAGITGTLPGASDYRSTSGAWAQEHLHIGRVLLADSGSTAASGTAFVSCFCISMLSMITAGITGTLHGASIYRIHIGCLRTRALAHRQGAVSR